jgi:hypothetical protein
MKKVLIVVILVVIVIIAGYLLFPPKSDRLNQYKHLLNPVISQLPDQNMLVVETSGEPNAVAGKAIKLLYKTFYSLKGVSKGLTPVAPRSRWNVSKDTPKDQWLGLFGIPIPASISTLPEIKNPDSLKIYITEWKYGTVAEILHVGPYDKEEPTVKVLTGYITRQGYKITGEHEEDYIKGPGMFGPGNPEKYLTIIRYRVEKAD